MSLFQRPVLRQSLRFKRAFHLFPNLLRKVFEQFSLGATRDAAGSGQPDRHDFLDAARPSGKEHDPITEQDRLVQAMSHIDEGPFGLLPDAHEL